MMMFYGLAILSAIFVNSVSVNSFHHKHHQRHSRNHKPTHNLDRLLNRLPIPRGHETTTLQPTTDLVMIPPYGMDNGNSIWDERSVDSRFPSEGKRWGDTMKGVQERHREEVEDKTDDADGQSEEEDEGVEVHPEQADAYRPWDTRTGGSYSQWKWDNMGTRGGVDNMFQVFRSGMLKPDGGAKGGRSSDYEVYLHTKRVAQETVCRWPRPKVVRVSDFYGSNKQFVPACTVLHQCADDTGCCTGGGQRCGPKTTNRVELYFFTSYIVGSAQSHQRPPATGVEKLPFYNHTECHCIDQLEEVMPRDGGLAVDFRQEKISDQGCRCPSEYTVRRLSNGSCSCDCFDKQRDCIKYKRGKEYFNHSDRLCIEMATCQQPSCDFGVYLRSSGRCPRKHEKLRIWSRHHN